VNIITKIVVARVAFGIVLEFYLFCSRLRGLQVGGGRWALGGSRWVVGEGGAVRWEWQTPQ